MDEHSRARSGDDLRRGLRVSAEDMAIAALVMLPFVADAGGARWGGSPAASSPALIAVFVVAAGRGDGLECRVAGADARPVGRRVRKGSEC